MINEYPDIEQYNYILGEFYLELGDKYRDAEPPDIEKALEYYSKIIELLPNEADGYIRSGFQYIVLKEDSLGIKNLEKAVELRNLQGDSLDVIIVIGLAYNEAERYEDSIKHYQNVLEKEPHKREYLIALSIIYDTIEDYDTSVEVQQKLLDINSDDPYALNYIGYTWVNQNIKLDEAEIMIRRALEHEPENGYYIDSIGWLYYRQGKLEEARELEKAVQIVPNHTVILKHLAEIYETLGLKEFALEIYQNIQKIEPDTEIEEKINILKEMLGETIDEN